MTIAVYVTIALIMVSEGSQHPRIFKDEGEIPKIIGDSGRRQLSESGTPVRLRNIAVYVISSPIMVSEGSQHPRIFKDEGDN